MSLDWVRSLEGIELLEDVDLSRFTTIKLRAKANVALVSTVEALRKLLPTLVEKGLRYHVIGWGANQVIASTENTLFLKLQLDFSRDLLKTPRDKYVLPASAPLNALQSHAQKFGLIGWEVFTGIPASLGGAIFMNAGTALGEIGSIVESVELVTPQGKVRKVLVEEGSFSYRKNHFVKNGEVIVGATLKSFGTDPAIGEKIKNYMEYRKSTQPLRSFNCGCVWKNYDNNHKAGLFIDKSGLSNLSVGDIEVSSLHANFYENKGSASFEDFKALTSLLEEQLLLHTGIKFELEAKVY